MASTSAAASTPAAVVPFIINFAYKNFVQHGIDRTATCKECGKVIKEKGSTTSNFLRHLHNKHKESALTGKTQLDNTPVTSAAAENPAATGSELTAWEHTQISTESMSAFHVRLFICIMAASSVVSSVVKQEHVLEGQDVRLHIQRPDLIQAAEDLTWMFNTRILVAKYTFSGKNKTIYANYKGRVDLSEDNYSLLLKNLQKSDSGLYQAIIEIELDDVPVAQYNVNIEDAVTPADQAGAPVSSSPDSCYLTVWTLLMGNFIVFLIFPF